MGRPKNSKNKSEREPAKIAARLGVDPYEILLHFANGNWKALGYKSETVVAGINAKGDEWHKMVIDPRERRQAAADAVKFIYPSLKAIELTGKDGEDFMQSFTTMMGEVAKRGLQNS